MSKTKAASTGSPTHIHGRRPSHHLAEVLVVATVVALSMGGLATGWAAAVICPAQAALTKINAIGS